MYGGVEGQTYAMFHALATSSQGKEPTVPTGYVAR
jgi:hypothetical protein